jgi:hypothetical protein
MIAVHMMQMAVMQVVRVPVVKHCCVAATGSVYVIMPAMNVMFCSHEAYLPLTMPPSGPFVKVNGLIFWLKGLVFLRAGDILG